MTQVELSSTLSSIVFRGLCAGLSTTITDEQISTAAASSASAAAAIIASLTVSYLIVPLRATQAAVIFAALASENIDITSDEITSTAASAVSCVSAVVSAVTSALSPSDYQPSAIGLQIEAAVQVFAGLALGLASITDDQISAVATLAVSAAAAIEEAL